jgi:hypothetical protein
LTFQPIYVGDVSYWNDEVHTSYEEQTVCPY